MGEAITTGERIQCAADPADGVKADRSHCLHPQDVMPDGTIKTVFRLHRWERLATENAYRCTGCGKTYVGGPVTETAQ